MRRARPVVEKPNVKSPAMLSGGSSSSTSATAVDSTVTVHVSFCCRSLWGSSTKVVDGPSGVTVSETFPLVVHSSRERAGAGGDGLAEGNRDVRIRRHLGRAARRSRRRDERRCVGGAEVRRRVRSPRARSRGREVGRVRRPSPGSPPSARKSAVVFVRPGAGAPSKYVAPPYPIRSMIRVSFPFAAHVSAVLQPSVVIAVRKRDLARGPRHVDRRRVVEDRASAGALRLRRCSSPRGRAGICPAGSEPLSSRELRRVGAEVAAAGRARVLERLALERNGGRPAVEDLDVVVRVRRSRVASAAVDLADDEVRRWAVRHRGRCRAGDREHRSDARGTGAQGARWRASSKSLPLEKFWRPRHRAWPL